MLLIFSVVLPHESHLPLALSLPWRHFGQVVPAFGLYCIGFQKTTSVDFSPLRT
jgi:hypothetical protein